jgi:imidazolonepropionase-like amidohydrolase
VRLAIQSDRIFTALADRTESGVVVVEDGRISAIVSSPPSDGTAVLRLAGTTLLPGFIDAHSHLSIVPSRGDQIGQMMLPVEVQLATARSNILADLLSGVTTLRSMAQELDVDFIVRDEVASGRTLGPDLVCSGVQLVKQGAHGYAFTAVASETDIEALVERNAARGAGLIKIFVTGGVSSVASRQGDSPFTAREIRCAADAAHRHGLKLAAHAHGGTGAALAIENGVDTIEHGVLLDDEMIDAAARRRLAIVGTFSIQDHPAGIQAGEAGTPAIVEKLRDVRVRVAATWRRILDTDDLRVAVGTDSMHGCLAFDIARLVDFGASPARALRAATAEGAAACGLADRGALVVGRRADLLAVRGNPVEHIHAVASPAFVMKGGRTIVAPPVDISGGIR